jgi:hypothetical protein
MGHLAHLGKHPFFGGTCGVSGNVAGPTARSNSSGRFAQRIRQLLRPGMARGAAGPTRVTTGSQPLRQPCTLPLSRSLSTFHLLRAALLSKLSLRLSR